MKKMIQSVCLFVCAAGIVLLIPVFLKNAVPIEVDIPQITVEEIETKKEETAQAQKAAKRQAKINRIYSCQSDEDCIIVDKDPCGCSIGPKGVTAINVGYITDFNTLNTQPTAKACPDVISTERECSETARAVCKAKTCKIAF